MRILPKCDLDPMTVTVNRIIARVLRLVFIVVFVASVLGTMVGRWLT